MSYILLVLAILPTILMGKYIYDNDRIEKEPTRLLVQLMASGVLAAFLTIFLTAILSTIFPFFNSDTNSLDPVSLAVYVFFGVALIEEFSKLFFTTLLSWKNKAFNHVYDAIVYSTFVSLGFATIENIMYIFENETVTGAFFTAIIRMLFSVPGHAFYGVIMGYYLGLAKLTSINNKKDKSQKYLILSLLVPAAGHFIFDYLLFLAEPVATILFLFFVICLFGFGVSRIKRMSNIPTMLFSNSPNYNLPPSNFNYNYDYCPNNNPPAPNFSPNNYPNNNHPVPNFNPNNYPNTNPPVPNFNPNNYPNNNPPAPNFSPNNYPNNNPPIPNFNPNNYVPNSNPNYLYKPKYCSNCGAEVTGPYCSNCGKKIV